MAGKSTNRIAYIDWMRGLACVVMFQTHCYDSWLGGTAREGKLYRASQLAGSLPAPLFLFLAGISFALVTDKLRQKGITAQQIAHTTIRRGGEIFLLALLFRLQEFLLGQPGAPWTDLFRVDILNVIGLALIMMGIACRIAGAGGVMDIQRLRRRTMAMAVGVGASIVLLTPPLWTTWSPNWMPWWLESYVNGVHIYGTPQSWLFPIFPWAGFAFAGLAFGILLLSDWAKIHEAAAAAWAAAGGVVLVAAGILLEASPIRIYAVHDFWHTSSEFFLIRFGVLLMILWGSHAWCRWGMGARGFSPMIEMGKRSLLVYWVHIELVYGAFSLLPKRAVGTEEATLGLVAIIVLMTLLATARNRFPAGGAEIFSMVRRAVRA